MPGRKQSQSYYRDSGNTLDSYSPKVVGGRDGAPPHPLDMRGGSHNYQDQPANMRGHLPAGVMSPVPQTSRASAPVSGHVYSVDHLVTWSVGRDNDVLTHEDGMRQLAKMERTSGIFTMRCTLTVSTDAIHIHDPNSQDEMEKFPLRQVREPMAVVRDKQGLYSNLVLFVVEEDVAGSAAPPPTEMHIFQVIGMKATELADDIAEAQDKLPKSSRSRRESSREPALRPTSLDTNLVESRRASYGSTSVHNLSVQAAIDKFNAPAEPAQTEVHASAGPSRPAAESNVRAKRQLIDDQLEQKADVQDGVSLLNRCFDEIERFVLRLKESVRAFDELSKRKHSKRQYGGGMLTMRSRAPAPADFIEIFQKFKLSINILAKLRPYLHNPNSPELVHFLFTPLGLIVEASRDPRHDIGDLVGKVVSPLLTATAVDLLRDCLSSKEYDFWMSLGDAWRTHRGQWSGAIASYRPRFSDGFKPPESLLEMFTGNPLATHVATVAATTPRSPIEETRRSSTVGPPTRLRAAEPVTPPTTGAADLPEPPHFSERRPDRDLNLGLSPRSSITPWDTYRDGYLKALQQRQAQICEVIQDRKATNHKELSIAKGDILEVLDDSRNWWKCSNVNGDQGFVPYTLVKKYSGPTIVSTNHSPNIEDIPSPPPPVVAPPPPSAIPVPPPLPPVLPPTVQPKPASKRPERSSSKKDKQKNNGAAVPNGARNGFDAELKQRLSRLSLLDNDGEGEQALHQSANQGGLRLSASMSAQVFIDQYSTEREVAQWLVKKEFLPRTCELLKDYNGENLFKLNPESIVKALGHAEGTRFNSQITLMKTTAKYTQNSSSELKALLALRKQRSGDIDGADRNTELPVFSANGDSDGSGDLENGFLQNQIRNQRSQLNRKY